MKELKTLSLSITRPLEESSLLMVLGGAGGDPPIQEKVNADCIPPVFVECTVNYNNCEKCSCTG